MGRVKLPIKRIENITNRQVTFSKRRNGLIKKAYELAILCDIDIALIMFSPSDRLSHFSGKRRIEDVITRYVALSEHDRHGDIRNPEYLLSTLKRLKTENDMALQAANPEATQSNLELEFCNLQSQLQMAEEQLRMYEPDPLKFTSLEELESYEKNLIDTIARVEGRKRCLLNNPIPSYDPSSVEMYLDSQEGLPNFENEITSWLPENGHNSNSVCVASESSCIPVSNQSTATVFDPLCHVSNVNVEHQHHHHHHDSIGGSHMNNSNNGGDQVQDNVLPPWHQAFLSLSSTELLAAFMPPTSFSLVKQQHEVEGPSFTSMLQQEHQTETISLSNCPQMPSSTGEGSEYDSKLP